MGQKFSSRLIILDRDGVINEDSDAYIKSPDEWLPIPESLEAQSGWLPHCDCNKPIWRRSRPL